MADTNYNVGAVSGAAVQANPDGSFSRNVFSSFAPIGIIKKNDIKVQY